MLIVSWQRTARRNPQGDTSPSGEREERRERGGWGGVLGRWCRCALLPNQPMSKYSITGNKRKPAMPYSVKYLLSITLPCFWSLVPHFSTFSWKRQIPSQSIAVCRHKQICIMDAQNLHLLLLGCELCNSQAGSIVCMSCWWCDIFTGFEKMTGFFYFYTVAGRSAATSLSHTLYLVDSIWNSLFFFFGSHLHFLVTLLPSLSSFFFLLNFTSSPLPDPHFSPFPSSDHLSFPSYQIP